MGKKSAITGKMINDMDGVLKEIEFLYTQGVNQTEMLRDQLDSYEKDFKKFNPTNVEVAKFVYKNIPESMMWTEFFNMTKITEENRIEIKNVIPMLRARSIELYSGMFVIPIQNLNSHNYKLGDVYRLVGTDYHDYSNIGMYYNGITGNNLPEDNKSIIAPTNEQISKWIASYASYVYKDIIAKSKMDDSPSFTPTNFLDELSKQNKSKGE